MENIIIIVGIAILFLAVVRFWLTQALVKMQKKQEFLREYLDILNNPSYKVRKI